MKYPDQEDKPKQKEILPDKDEIIPKRRTEIPVISEKNTPEIDIVTDKVSLVGKQRFPVSIKRRILIPGILALLAILTGFVFFLNHQSKIKWAKEDALPQIEQLANEYKMDEAFVLSQKAGKYISKDKRFKELISTITNKITIMTDPAGAEVIIREYSDTAGPWKSIGRTPIQQLQMPKHSYYLMKIEKPGYESILGVMQTRIDTVFRKLFKTGTVPPGMVYVYGYNGELTNGYLKPKNGFFIDRSEVTNKQYKEFIDNGGYRKPEFWKNTFIKDGNTLSFMDALSEFTDKTGQFGPSMWIAGDYPDGQADYPVSGISWYEAAAYAEYAGKELPTIYHWGSASGFNFEAFGNYFYSKLFSFSNFKGIGPEPVGFNPGINCFGASDMAGNVREWCWNQSPDGRIVRGGAWDDAVYMYSNISQLPPFDRSPKNGFRCVSYIDKPKIPQTAFNPYAFVGKRDYSKEKPVNEAIFKVFKNRFLYDNTALDAVIEKRDTSSQDWTVEKISFNAAYENERVIAYLFLPVTAKPPYQTLVFFPGSNAQDTKNFNNNYWANWFTDFILKGGRAVMYPVYKGTFERINDKTPISWQGHQYADWLNKWVKDFKRSVDYLQTRPDINAEKLGYYGHSWGARLGAIIPSVEDRLKVSVLIVGGLSQNDRIPETEELNYLPYVKIPVLMLNGKYDMAFPYETAVKPFFELLGTPSKDKYIRIYDTDHYVPKNEMIKEVLSFLDHYLGPIK
jgi:dienelactone hydrolase